MGSYSPWEVQKSLYEKLTGDATLMGMITGVFDRVTEGSAYPYVTIGDIAASDWSSKTTSGQRLTAELHIFSRGGGRKEAGQIMDRLHTLLHDGSMSVTGYSVILMRFVAGDVRRQADGLTYEGVMRFQILVHTA